MIFFEGIDVHHPIEDHGMEGSTGGVARFLSDDRSAQTKFWMWSKSFSALVERSGAEIYVLMPLGHAERDGQVDLIEAAARKLDVPLTIIAPVDERLGALYQAKFALIRPDQHVAWRGDRLPSDLHGLLERITGD